MNQMIKKCVGILLLIPFIILFGGNHAFVHAAENTKEVEFLCTGNALGIIDIDINMDVAIQSNVPDEVAPGEKFTVEDVQTTIDMEVSDTLRNFINPLEGSVSAFNLGFDNAKEETVNIAGDGLAFGPVDVPDDADTVQFSVPNEGGLTAENSAVEAGTIEVLAGPFTTVVSTSLADVEVECVPVDGQDLTVNSMTVAEESTDVDVEAPVITLNGDNPLEVEVGAIYEEPGATAEDNVDGDVTDQLQITDDVDTDKAGEYEVVYTVTDEAGNKATEKRLVIVKAENGDDGEDDKDGIDGEDGKDGEDGIDGEDGKDGEDGIDGEDGKDGEDGIDGEDGKDGEDGTDGEDGKDGEDGTDGEDGKDGTDGTDGEDGRGGKAGADGKDGNTLTKTTEDNGSVYKGENRLPNTATSTPLLLMIGGIFVIIGGVVFLYRKKTMV